MDISIGARPTIDGTRRNPIARVEPLFRFGTKVDAIALRNPTMITNLTSFFGAVILSYCETTIGAMKTSNTLDEA